jgi:hypothetical protein
MKTFNEALSENDMTLQDEIILGHILEMNLYDVVELPTYQVLKESVDITPHQYVDLSEIMDEYGNTKLRDIDEGIIGRVLGGIAGFAVGPSVGRVIANALGIDKGIIYDMLTSRLVGAALGSALTKYIGGAK